MHEELQCHGVTDVFVAGVAADVCVQYTAEDAASLGYRWDKCAHMCVGWVTGQL